MPITKFNLNKNIIKKFNILFISTIIGNISTLLAMLILAKYIGPINFGLYALVLSIVSIALFPATSGLNSGIVFEVANGKSLIDTVYAGLISYIVIFILAMLIIQILFSSEINQNVKIPAEMKYPAMILCAGIIISSFADSYYRSIRNIKKLALLRLFSGIGSLTICLLVVYYDYKNEYSAIIVKFSEFLIFFILSFLPLKKIISAKNISFRGLIKYAFPAAISILGMAIFSNVDKFIISSKLDAVKLGQYSMLFFLTYTMVSRCAEIAISIFFPIAVSSNNKIQIINKMLASTPSIVAAFFIIMYIFTKCSLLLLGASYSVGHDAELLFCFGSSLYFTTHMHWWLVASIGGAGIKLFAKISLISAILLIGLDIILINNYQMSGAIYGLTLGSIFLFASGFITLKLISIGKLKL